MAKVEEEKIVDAGEIDLSFYAVMSKDGKWFRSKGYNGGGDSWVDNVNKAKLFTMIGPAKAVVTWWSKHYPSFGTPDLVRIIATSYEVIDQNARVQKKIEDDKIKEINRQIKRTQDQIDYLSNKKDADNKMLADLRIRLAKEKNKLL